MMKKEKTNKINNIQDLHLEMRRLKNLVSEQEAYLGHQYELLKTKVEAPARFFKNILSFIPGGSLINSFLSSRKNTGLNNKNQNLVSKILRIGTSAALDRLFLRKAGVIKRLIIGLLSQQAVGLIDKNVTNNMIDKVADWIRPKGKRNKKDLHKDVEHSLDFGIPPDSETS